MGYVTSNEICDIIWIMRHQKEYAHFIYSYYAYSANSKSAITGKIKN